MKRICLRIQVSKFVIMLGVLALAITAGAGAQNIFWDHNTINYRCAGVKEYVICHTTPRRGRPIYRIMIDAKRVWVSANNRLIYECSVGKPRAQCRSYP